MPGERNGKVKKRVGRGKVTGNYMQEIGKNENEQKEKYTDLRKLAGKQKIR